MGAMPDTGAVPPFLYNAFRFHEGLKTKGATMKVERIGESGALSQKTRAGAWIFVSGQRPKSENGSILGLGDFEAQADAALESLAQTLNQAGIALTDVIKLTAYLVNPRDIDTFHGICSRTFLTQPPTGTTVAVSSLQDPDALIEIEASAYLKSESNKSISWSNFRTGPFSEEVRCGNTILISGQTARTPSADFATQLYSVYDKINEGLARLGAEQKHLVKINYFIANPLYYRQLYRIREEVFKLDWPGDSVVSVRALDEPGALVECDAVALAPTAKAEFVNSPDLPHPFNFSNVVIADGLAYVSGQVARDKHKNLVLPGDFGAQFRQALGNIEIALNSTGCSLDEAVKLSCFISHPAYFEESLAIRREVFGVRAPAVTTVSVDSMGGFPEALCEVDAIAAIP